MDAAEAHVQAEIELFGASVSRFSNKTTSDGIDSTLMIDLTIRRDDGQLLE